MREKILESAKTYFQSKIRKHQVNVEIILNNPMALPDHTDVLDAIEREISIIAEYHDKLEVLNNYFRE